MSYLTARPARILAVDLNAHHIALLKLKVAGARTLPDAMTFQAMFAAANRPGNAGLFDRHMAPSLDPATRRYWEGRDATGRRRITRFERGFLRMGALGRFIAAGHLVARLHGVRPTELLSVRGRSERRRMFARDVAPLFDKPLLKFLVSSRASLFGLGIPPAQYETLSGGRPMQDVLRERLERLVCEFDLQDNYFAWQALGRAYGVDADAPLPPYLQARHFGSVRCFADRIEARQQSLTDALAEHDSRSFDKYSLLDAQDWMSPRDLNALWAQITRTTRPGGRVLFRTAAEPTILPGRVDDALLDRWRYDEVLSRELTRKDRSAIYGGVHVYSLKESV